MKTKIIAIVLITAILPFLFISGPGIADSKTDNSSKSATQAKNLKDLRTKPVMSCGHNHSEPAGRTGKHVCSSQNHFVADVLKEKGRNFLTVADLPESIIKNQLKKYKDSKIVKHALKRIVELDPPQEDFSELRVDKTGELLYACRGLSIEAAGAEDITAEGPAVSAGEVPSDQPPIRHSKPGSPNIIYLDFTGEDISGTAWNDGNEVWKCRPYNRSGDESTFTESEQNDIITAWAKVAEDFAPFDVDVTTERPAVFDSRVAHVMITPGKDANGVSLPHDGYGGIGYVGVFGGGSWAPHYLITFCQPYNGDSAAQVISHEVGHNMGLSHDGKGSSSYYRGHGSGETSWGPIMGASYGRSVTQFSKGEYTDATNLQDDLAIISSKLSYKSDDHGGSRSSASALNNNLGIISDSGLLGRTGEKDFFKFSANAGAVTLIVNSYKGELKSNGGNTDLTIELKNAQGNTIASHSPESDTDARIDFNIPARGDYYLSVSPDFIPGWEDSPPTGYPVYGTLGQYFISGEFVPYGNSAPEIETAASASPDVIQAGGTTTLSVSAFDPDFDPLTYSWTKVSGAGNVLFSSPSSDITEAEFASDGVYTLKVTVSDGQLTAASTVTVTVNANTVVISESGSFNIKQAAHNTWNKVNLSKTYSNPVIIFSPLTTKGGQPAHIRVKNVLSGSFEWEIEEWDYLDGYHLAEKVDYIVMEAGKYTLPDGRIFIAGNAVAKDSFTSHNFVASFTQKPVVVVQLSSAVDSTAATARIRNITSSKFDVLIQSQEANGKKHGDEIVSYIAVEPGLYDDAGLQEADVTARSVNHNWFNIQFAKSYQTTPSFFGSIQSYYGSDTSDLRITNLNQSEVDVKVHEEQSKDSEINHTTESVGYILFDLNK